MKKLIALVAMAVGVTLSGSALAHGAKPKHGGVVQTASDLQFELANSGGKPVIYVEDHGQNKTTAGASGKLTVLKGEEKTEYALQPFDDNALVVVGEAKLAPGTKAIAAITFADKKTVTVRFSIK
jgi:hypothetical protein